MIVIYDPNMVTKFQCFLKDMWEASWWLWPVLVRSLAFSQQVFAVGWQSTTVDESSPHSEELPDLNGEALFIEKRWGRVWWISSRSSHMQTKYPTIFQRIKMLWTQIVCTAL